MNAELAVGPGLKGRPAASLCQSAKRLERIFVAVLGVNRFAGAKLDQGIAYSDRLPFGAGKMHFNAAAFAVVKCVVLESLEIEIPAEFAIDAGEHIEIEL